MSARLLPITETSALTLHTAASALAMPPTSFGVVPTRWVSGAQSAHIAAFDLAIYGAGALNLTSSALYGMIPQAGTIADDTFTAATTDICTATSHGLVTGDGPVQLTTTDTLPAGLSLATDYWVIRIDADTFYLATSLANALAGTRVDVTSTGTGTHTLSDTADTKLVKWFSFGDLAATIALTSRQSYIVRVNHNPMVQAYALVGTLSASTVTAKLYPICEV